MSTAPDDEVMTRHEAVMEDINDSLTYAIGAAWPDTLRYLFAEFESRIPQQRPDGTLASPMGVTPGGIRHADALLLRYVLADEDRLMAAQEGFEQAIMKILDDQFRQIRAAKGETL